MQTIYAPSENTLKLLGKPKPATAGLRWMHYVVSTPVERGVLLFHVLTRELLLLTPEEYAQPQRHEALRNHWFLVPQELEDRRYADQVRFIRRAMEKKTGHITTYTIFPTTDCNARCFYCYELGRSRVPMSEETARKAAGYIAAHCGGQRVKLRWFGGEPLYNRPVIDSLCQELTALGVAYTSSMVSNAYLFDDETVKKAVELWQLKSVQITLDGTEEIYNRSKAYIYKEDPSCYQTVLNNIQRLLDAQVTVHIRMNMDRHNAEDLQRLAQELYGRFGGNSRLRAYSHLLFEYAGNQRAVRSAEERSFLYAKQRELKQKLMEYGMLRPAKLQKKLPTHFCMADSGDSLTILPGGQLGLCEHFSEDHFVGHLDREGLDPQMVRSFRQQWEPLPECAACFYYPQCIRLKNCLEYEDCYPETRQELRLTLLHAMRRTYEAWLKQEETEEDTAFCSSL